MAVSVGTLVLGVRDGDRAAFAELYDRYARMIRAICFDATGDFHTAADLTQEVFLRAFQKLATLREPQTFSAWLVGITRRVCREWRRRQRRERSGIKQLSELSQTVESSKHENPFDEEILILRHAVASLPEIERLALHAFYLQGLDAEQARAVLSLSKSGFYRVLSSARKRLRRVMSKEVLL